MQNNPLHEIQKRGQSIWYDNIRRGMLKSGEMQKMIEDGEIFGVTSNPTIFEKAINGSNDYNEALNKFIKGNPETDVSSIYNSMVHDDIQETADLLRPVYERTEGKDGYVSIEVSPLLAHNTKETIAEAKLLIKSINRPNVMIKVPATKEGIPAITKLIAEGINVNATLMFSLQDYIDVSEAYISGLENLTDSGGDISKVCSVASFFVSRIDTAVDKLLSEDSTLRGKIAIANAKKTYSHFKNLFSSERFSVLKKRGARVQRPLWASTGTKNPKYSDVLYIEELIGKDTVNTVPHATLLAFRDHGTVRDSLDEDIEQAEEQLSELKDQGIDLDKVTARVKAEGVQLFSNSFESLMTTLTKKRETILSGDKEKYVKV